MSQFITKITTELTAKLEKTFIANEVFSRDNLANRLEIKLTKDHVSQAIDGTIQAYAKRVDGTTVNFVGTIVNDTAIVELPIEAYAKVGPLYIAVDNTVGDVVTTIAFCETFVMEKSTDSIVFPETIPSDVPALLAEIAAMRAATSDANAAAARANAGADALEATRQSLLQAVSDKGDEIEDNLDDKIVAVTTKHDNDMSALGNEMDTMNSTILSLQTDSQDFLASVTNDDEGISFYNKLGERVFGPLKVAGSGGGGGGGGSVTNSQMEFTSGVDWVTKNYVIDKTVDPEDRVALPITVNWSSTLDGQPTGAGALILYVNNMQRYSANVQQGNVTINVAPYLSTGENVVRIAIVDAYDKTGYRNYRVNAIDLSISSSFDSGTPVTGALAFPYTPMGAVTKEVHFKLDGTELETYTTSISNRQLSYAIPAQEHGVHSLEVWYTTEINGEEVESNHLYYEFMALESGETDAGIWSNFNQSAVRQFDTVTIPFKVYAPSAMSVETNIYENDTLISTAAYDRQWHNISYPADTAGDITIKIAAAGAEKEISLHVDALNIPVSAETEGLELFLSSKGHSNSDTQRAVWTSGNYAMQFTGMNWVSNGWIPDSDDVTAMRFSGNGRGYIDFKPFATDRRASGFTFEVEFAARNVRDYEAEIMSCFSGGRGIALSAQTAVLRTEQSEIGTQYGENTHVRVSFVGMKMSDKRLLLLYANGILSGVVEYPENDDFSQISPVGISFGGNGADLDLYTVRYYSHDLTMQQMTDNFTADAPSGREMLNRYNRNNVYDEYGNIVIEKLPANLPYLVITGALPTYKGNKLKVSGRYVDPLHPEKSFSFANAEIDVQGTSSQYYPRKNYKIKFKGGFTINGQTVAKYTMNDNAVPTATFTMKADFASSEGANNTVGSMLYNDGCLFKTEAQKENPHIRQTIEGMPIVIFHNNGSTTEFIGKYNFNNDKGTPEIFGYADGDESWEFKNNTSLRVLFKSADFTGSDWQNDFEGSYPDGYLDKTNLERFCQFVCSTDTEQATNEALDEAVPYTDTVDGEDVTTTYTNDTAAYRLAKFKHEFPAIAHLDSFLCYYAFTHRFLLADNRAKNFFLNYQAATGKFYARSYDNDTMLGINNEGEQVFGYWLEDIDQTESGADVYNGQNSVLWKNMRACFWPEIQETYQTIRSNGHWGHDEVEARFSAHQGVYGEAIPNEDGWFKYIEPNVAAYYPDAQGMKTLQRQFWDYYRSLYIDSQMDAGDALRSVITIRAYAKANITITPYAWMYATVKYGSYMVQERAEKDEPTVVVNPLDNLNDTEVNIPSAKIIKSLGDISGLKPGLVDISAAENMVDFIAGNPDVNYQNGNAFNPTFGNNKLMEVVDCRNITGLVVPVDMRGCVGLKEAYFDGTNTPGVQFPDGGVLDTVHLPATITNLTLLNQPEISELVAPTANLTTLRVENCPTVNTKALLNGTPANARVRLIGFAWEAADAAEIEALLDKLDTMRGLDESGQNTDTAQISGTITTESLTGAQVASYNSRYPYLTVSPRHITCTVTFKSFDGATVLGTKTSTDYADVDDSGISASRSQSDKYTYTKVGWALTPSSGIEPNANKADPDALKNITADRTVYAAYSGTLRSYTIYFARSSDDGGGTLESKTLTYGSQATYTGATPTTTKGSATDYPFQGWSPALGQVTGSVTYYAVFGSPKEIKEIADSWDTIFAALDDGSYKTKYKVGNYKAFDLGTEGSGQLNFIGIDKDTCANGAGMAPISCAIGFILNTNKRMNPTKVDNTEGTGALGGWDKSEMKKYLTTVIWAKIPAEVRARIVPVKKYTRIYQASDETVVNDVETTETVYLLSRRETAANVSSSETVGPQYTEFFSDDESRKMYKNGATSATYWWTRSATSASTFGYADSYGYPINSYNANYTNGVVIAFCLGTYEQCHTKSSGLAALKASMQAGTYATDYAPGDLIPIENDGENSANYVQIMGFDMNPKADGSGNAKVAAAYYYLLPASKRMNPAKVANTEGTGALGGWEKTEMRDYLRNTIYPAMQNDLKELIVPVKKYTRIYQASDETAVNNVETTETVYLLSDREVFAASGYETAGPAYTEVFSSNATRKRKKRTSSSAAWYWLRSAGGSTGFRGVGGNGDRDYDGAGNSGAVLVGFDLDIDNIT